MLNYSIVSNYSLKSFVPLLFVKNVQCRLFFFPHFIFYSYEHATYNLALFREDKKIHSWGAAPLTTPNVFLLELLLLWSQPIMSPRYSALQKRMSFIMLTKQ